MLRLDKYVGGAWSAVDLTATGVCRFRLQIGYSHPAQLTFCVKQAQHTTPIPAYAGVRFWDDEALDADAEPFSSSNPLFLGFVEDIDPTDSNELSYTCLDPTARAANKIPIMSTAWTGPAEEGTAAVPRLVLNSSIDNDDDWSYCRAFGLTVGQMVAILLEDAQLPLEAVFAAPGSGPAYESADLSGLTYEPQEKIVFTSEPIRSGVMRLIDDWAPEWRMLFYPKTRKWRFGNIGLSPQVTYTLNDFSEASPHPVLKLNLDRSLEGRYTAVKIYGPEASANEDISVLGETLIDVSDGPTLETYGAGAIVEGKNKFQIADSERWRMARLLPTPIKATHESRIGPNAWVEHEMWTRTPTLMARWERNDAGTDRWQTIAATWVYDQSTGTISLKDQFLYRWNDNPQVVSSILQPNRENPSDVRLIYPRYIEPLYVRWPATGYEGTAYTEHALENELKIYDESLAIGYMFNAPVTSATRLAKFQILAQAILETKKNVLYHGGMTLEGIDYEFHRLDRRVNVAAVNGDGAALTTGWEAMKGIVTDVEYDWEEQITTVQFSSDQSEQLGFDPARIKEQLRVGAEYISQIVTAWATLGTVRRFTEWGTPYLAQSISAGGSVTPVAVDPFFGTIDPLIG